MHCEYRSYSAEHTTLQLTCFKQFLFWISELYGSYIAVAGHISTRHDSMGRPSFTTSHDKKASVSENHGDVTA